MCGIAGWIGAPSVTSAQSMLAALKTRGPDAEGSWWSGDRRVWLGHRRLKILDLSDTANQPMVSPCGKFVLTYNGEIYNYLELRKDLEQQHGLVFNTHSDTEVLLKALLQWGIERTVAKIRGMYAFAWWDGAQQRLTLARDPMGIKPLYYAHVGDQFIFASDLDALRASGALSNQLNQDALHYYFRYLCTPCPQSIFRDAHKLPPGTTLIFEEGKSRISHHGRATGIADTEAPSNLDQAADQLDGLLRASVSEHMASDVPNGAFLSGGIDSSLVTAMMQSLSEKPVDTFSIGFDDPRYDESRHARAIAKHLGTHHYEQILTPRDIIDHLEAVISLHDEPFADNSSIPTYLLCGVARRHVTVALSGDGGDELFAGYPRYFWASRIAALQARLGGAASRAIGQALNSLTPLAGKSRICERAARFGRYLAAPRADTYRQVIASWGGETPILSPMTAPLGLDCLAYPELSWAEEMMRIDRQTYLPDDILTKLDRMSMAVSLEARVPMLDPRIVAFAESLPLAFKCSGKGDKGKIVLRSVLSRYVPPHLFDRPKSGFGLPLHEWLRHDLREWAESYINPYALQRFPFLDAARIRETWRRFQRGDDALCEVWSVIAFMIWCKAKGA